MEERKIDYTSRRPQPDFEPPGHRGGCYLPILPDYGNKTGGRTQKLEDFLALVEREEKIQGVDKYWQMDGRLKSNAQVEDAEDHEALRLQDAEFDAASAAAEQRGISNSMKKTGEKLVRPNQADLIGDNIDWLTVPAGIVMATAEAAGFLDTCDNCEAWLGRHQEQITMMSFPDRDQVGALLVCRECREYYEQNERLRPIELAEGWRKKWAGDKLGYMRDQLAAFNEQRDQTMAANQ